MKATIFDIQRNSFVDGPGIRTTVFFKGCNLRCAWCHNPESQSGNKEFLFYPNKCILCGRCANATPEDENFICYHDARISCGKDYTVLELFREISRDMPYYAASRGGVTFSGGECMLQIDFLKSILRECKINGMHTAVDTAGHVPFDYFQRILSYTDLILYDIKCLDSKKHKQYTGVPNDLILDNLAKLLQINFPILIRIPVIAGVNDTIEEMTAIRNYLEAHGKPKGVELLQYHALGEHKYEALGRKNQAFTVPTEEKMALLCAVFKTDNE
ncbi:MAG: glycyl-radical enzyme activating protein [Ruminococcaceae bacterium]|nr:glycyl-radical enzyme activating protein [Oscillospiraceae bacterium]